MRHKKHIETELVNGNELGPAKLKLYKRGKAQSVCNTTSSPELDFNEVKEHLSDKPIRAYRPTQQDD